MKWDLTTVSGIYPPDLGGPATFANEFSKWLVSQNFAPHVVTLTDSKSIEENAEGFLVSKVSRRFPLPLRVFITCKLIFASGKKSSSLLVNGCFIETFLASLVTGIRYTVKIPGDIVWERARNQNATQLNIQEFQDSRVKSRYRALRFLFSASIRRASRVIVPSIELKQLCIRWGVEETRIHIVHNSVNDELFYKDSKVEKLYDVIAVGRLVSWKGLTEVITACNEMGLSLAVVGDGPQESELKQLVESIGARVYFLGKIDKAKLREKYNQSKLFVLNSTYEGTSHALLEARMCGLPTLARSGVGSNDFVLAGSTGGILFGGRTGLTLLAGLRAAFSLDVFSEGTASAIAADTKFRFGSDKLFHEIYRLSSNTDLL